MNWPIDYTTPEKRLYPNLYEIKARMAQISELRRWIPTHLLPVFDEVVKEKK